MFVGCYIGGCGFWFGSVFDFGVGGVASDLLVSLDFERWGEMVV